MKRPVRGDDGKYHIDGKTYVELIGSRQKVWHGTAYKTSGGLLKEDLMMNKWGRIVSKKKHFTAKEEMRLLEHGYGYEEGEFGFKKVDNKKGKTAKNKKDKSKKNKSAKRRTVKHRRH